MLKRYAEGFYHVGEILSRIRNMTKLYEITAPNKEVDEDSKAEMEKQLNVARFWCNELGLVLSVKGVDHALERLKSSGLKRGDLHHIFGELMRRVQDEIGSAHFLHVPSDTLELYQNASIFGDDALNKISDIATDISEAGSCLALGRFTACVFHLMRIMERGTQALGTKLGVQLAQEKNWQNILDECNSAIRRLNPQTPGDKAIRDRYSAATAHLQNVKEAWRNPVMHPKQTYTKEEAKPIYDNVKTFIAYLAKDVL